MPDYQKMYYIHCAAASKAIDAEDFETARQILQAALYEAEELYIDTSWDCPAVIEEQKRKFTHDLVDRLLDAFHPDDVYSAIYRLQCELK